ncbi:MAG: DUF1036 domain-containing protein [Leptolyngbyaceae cyanobacterium RU_5_1]|nr:DUF1036 domain-containing protein [Leptolyngbyaceae cyanobacterium RU_5_1]
MRTFYLVLLGIVAIAIGLVGNLAFISSPGTPTSPAGGGLGFCNRSKQGKVYVAIAYPVEQGNWQTEGWLNLEEDECGTIVQGKLANRYYYFLAEADNGYAWKGTHKFCVSSTSSFVFKHADKQCQGSDVRWTGFREVNTGKNVQSFMLNLE